VLVVLLVVLLVMVQPGHARRRAAPMMVVGGRATLLPTTAHGGGVGRLRGRRGHGLPVVEIEGCIGVLRTRQLWLILLLLGCCCCWWSIKWDPGLAWFYWLVGRFVFCTDQAGGRWRGRRHQSNPPGACCAPDVADARGGGSSWLLPTISWPCFYSACRGGHDRRPCEKEEGGLLVDSIEFFPRKRTHASKRAIKTPMDRLIRPSWY
jgi:hypothetical protein